MAAPGQRMRRVVAVVVVEGEGRGVGVRVEIIRRPTDQRRLELAGAEFSDQLLLVGGDDVHLHAGQSHGLLHRLGHFDLRRVACAAEPQFEAVRIARLGQQRLRLGDVELVGVVGNRAEQTYGQEGLVHVEAALEEAVGHAVVVDEILQRQPHLRVLQPRVGHVEPDVPGAGVGEGLDLDVLVAGQRLELVGLQAERDVDIAFFQQQLLRTRFGHVANDHPLGLCRAEMVAGIGLHRHRLVGFPGHQPVGA